MKVLRKDFRKGADTRYPMETAEKEMNQWLENNAVIIISVETLRGMSRATGQGSSGMTEVGIRVWYMKP